MSKKRISNPHAEAWAFTLVRSSVPLWLSALALGFLLVLTGTEALADSELADSYRLGAGDRIRVTVFGQDELSGEFETDGNGRVSLPLIQVIDAAGLTTAQLADVITDKLQPDYLKQPRVSVDVLSYRPFYIIGEVRNPGSYPFVNNMTVVTAVALAGGYSYRAGKKKITVIRGDDPDKKKQRITENARIMPGDTIVVPERYF